MHHPRIISFINKSRLDLSVEITFDVFPLICLNKHLFDSLAVYQRDLRKKYHHLQPSSIAFYIGPLNEIHRYIIPSRNSDFDISRNKFLRYVETYNPKCPCEHPVILLHVPASLAGTIYLAVYNLISGIYIQERYIDEMDELPF